MPGQNNPEHLQIIVTPEVPTDGQHRKVAADGDSDKR